MIQPLVRLDEHADYHLCDCSYRNHRQRETSSYVKDWHNHHTVWKNPPRKYLGRLDCASPDEVACPRPCTYYTLGHHAMVQNCAEYARYEHEIREAILDKRFDEPEVLKWIENHTRSYGELTQWFDYLLATIEDLRQNQQARAQNIATAR